MNLGIVYLILIWIMVITWCYMGVESLIAKAEKWNFIVQVVFLAMLDMIHTYFTPLVLCKF